MLSRRTVCLASETLGDPPFKVLPTRWDAARCVQGQVASCALRYGGSTYGRMATVADLTAAADAFMASPKRVLGAEFPPQWAPGFTPHEAVMKYPLEVQGELIGAQLMVVGFPRERVLKFRLGILFPAMICRLDYTDETHANSVDGMLAGSVPPIVQGPHYHAWPLNRRFFRGSAKPPKLHDAVPYNEAGRTFDAVLRWFFQDTNIEQLPPNHMIELPRSDLLL